MAKVVPDTHMLPVGGRNKSSLGWWGVWTLIVTEGSLFGYLLLSYYYLWSQQVHRWPPDGLPKVSMSGLNTVILLSSSLFVWLAERAMRKSRKTATVLWLGVAVLLGAIFAGIQVMEWHDKPYGLTGNLYASLYFTITGFHLLHVVVGLLVLLTLMLWSGLGYFDQRRYEALSIGGLYWHFVDVVWIFVFSSFFLMPYVVGR